MKVFAVLSILAVSAYGARLDNKYIPPPQNAQSAGGFNLDAPRLALPSNVQNTYSAPQGAHSTYQQQNVQRQGAHQGTYTSHTSGNGFNSAAAGSFVSSGAQPNYQRPAYQPNQRQPQQPTYQQPQQPSYQQPQQSSYQPAQPAPNNYYQKDQYNNQASTTPIPILKFENEPHQGDGRYRFSYLTGNGIMAEEEGYLNNPNAQYPDYPEQVAVGSYSYTAPGGEQISLSYKADANGFVPVGDHLPVAPDQTAEWYEQVELHKKIAAEVEAEGQRLAELMAQQQQQNPQQGYQQQGYQQNPQQGYQQQGYQQQQQQQQNYQQQKPQQHSPQYNAQASNVYQTQQQFQGYNQNAQPIQNKPQAQPQQQYLPPGRSHGKK